MYAYILRIDYKETMAKPTYHEVPERQDLDNLVKNYQELPGVRAITVLRPQYSLTQQTVWTTATQGEEQKE